MSFLWNVKEKFEDENFTNSKITTKIANFAFLSSYHIYDICVCTYIEFEIGIRNWFRIH